MTGLEKVTGKIIADAEADARATLAAAQADCEAADAAAAAKTEADCDGLRESAGREGESLIRRAKSAAEMARRRGEYDAEVSAPDHGAYENYRALKQEYAKMIREEAEREECFD